MTSAQIERFKCRHIQYLMGIIFPYKYVHYLFRNISWGRVPGKVAVLRGSIVPWSQSSTGNNYSPFLHPRGICRFQLFSGVHAFTQLLRNANKQTNLHLENSSSAPVLPETKRHCYGPNVLVFSQSSYAKIPTLKDAGSRR